MSTSVALIWRRAPSALLFAVLWAPLALSAQPADSLRTELSHAGPVLEIAEVSPSPIGGLAAVVERVVYPEAALRDSVQGTVMVRMVIEPDGAPSQVAAIRPPDDRLAAAAVAAVEASPFTPGLQGGEAARVQFVLPVAFRLPAPSPPAEGPEEAEKIRVQPILIGGLQGLTRRVVYPEAARQAGMEGIVVVEFTVNKEGAVVDAAVKRSAGMALNLAAVQAVLASQFTPGLIDGEPVDVRFAVPVTFRLSGPGPASRNGYGDPIAPSRRRGL